MNSKLKFAAALSLSILSQAARAEESRTRDITLKNGVHAQIGYTFEQGKDKYSNSNAPQSYDFNFISQMGMIVREPDANGEIAYKTYSVGVINTVIEKTSNNEIVNVTTKSSSFQLSCATVSGVHTCVGQLGSIGAGQLTRTTDGHIFISTNRFMVMSSEGGVVFEGNPLE